MEVEFAGDAWEKSIDESRIMLKNEDKEVLKSLSKLLGSTGMQGQIEQLNLVNCFLDEQIKEARIAKNKNAILYRKLGVIVGLVMVIILI